MSKASDYAKKIREAESIPEPFYSPGGDGFGAGRGDVSSKGHLVMSGNIHADMVPAFIAWLQETFLDAGGEP